MIVRCFDLLVEIIKKRPILIGAGITKQSVSPFCGLWSVSIPVFDPAAGGYAIGNIHCCILNVSTIVFFSYYLGTAEKLREGQYDLREVTCL
jgi:hypothetical protein